MRLRISSLRRIVKKNLFIEFVQQDLTSYGGLELVRRYFRLIDLNRRIRKSFNAYGLGGDYGCGCLLLLVITLFVVGDVPVAESFGRGIRDVAWLFGLWMLEGCKGET